MSEEREDGDRGEREGEDTQTLSLSSGTHRIYTTVSPKMKTEYLGLSCENRGTCVCVSEDREHGEGVGVHPTLLTDTRRRVISLAENAVRMPGVEFREPRNLCVCVRKECGHGDGVGVHGTVTLLTDTRRRVVSLVENTVRMSGVELRKPRNLCVCEVVERPVSEK